MKRIILASNSFRRKELLKQIGLKFEPISSDIDENLKEKLSPRELTRKLSRLKAEKVASNQTNAIIIAADEVVVLHDEILGKPHSKEKTREMLRKISGQKVSCLTSFTILDTETKKKITQSGETLVYIKKLSSEEIDKYTETGEPLDKAGAFAIQEMGVFMVEKVEGDYSTIVGLPLFSLIEALKKFEINIFKN